MTRREYVLDVWLPEHGTWLTLACAVLGAVTAPDVPGAGAQALAWLGAAAFWGGFLVALRAVTWKPWRDEAVEAPRPENVVPMRPPGPPKGLH
ncbi:hypothetical protein C0214_10945 [Methylobacterium sp. DM1]|jgi:hypothetical protein|uniref:Uncharacterized protein n=1 Tax=Methylorubrum populi (strain ATCC BAA-705 / NCIMB 13946 / BJ001) TaxID=441620 RepID=B1ZJC3_METPB|nr:MULTISPECIES: hypothetical protein [Methylorubrum]ACB80028.1 hypothetical protein Mpop_1865 [Methylorubrum populi BJ001]AWI88722.1 hypothetical protein C0214_10945 [Methylobacterium sp. DM1]